MHVLYSLEKIQTPRLTLRPITVGDEHSIYRLTEHSSALLRPWLPWAQAISFERTCAFVQREVAAWQLNLDSNLPMVITRQADQAVIGMIEFCRTSDVRQGIYEIGCWCDLDYQGQGYMTESVNALTRYVFDGLGASVVTALILVDNPKSHAVIERLGFAYQSQDHDSFGLYNVYYLQDTESLPDLHISWVNYTADDR